MAECHLFPWTRKSKSAVRLTMIKLCRAICDFVYMAGDSTHQHHSCICDRYMIIPSASSRGMRRDSLLRCSRSRSPAPEVWKISKTWSRWAQFSALNSATHLRNHLLTSPCIKICSPEPFVHYLYTCCTHDSTGLLENV